MNVLTIITTIAGAAVQAFDPKLQRRLIRMVQAFRRPAHSYENLSLSYELEISDPKGHLARLQREQRVRFLTSEAGVVRDLVWGDGAQDVGYRASGATTIARRKEGMTQVVWLGLPSRPAPGQTAVVRSSRTILDGLRETEEFLEVRVERPTKKLRLKVVFPKERSPTRVMMEASDSVAGRELASRLHSNGRAVVTWSGETVKPFETYRIRWTW